MKGIFGVILLGLLVTRCGHRNQEAYDGGQKGKPPVEKPEDDRKDKKPKTWTNFDFKYPEWNVTMEARYSDEGDLEVEYPTVLTGSLIIPETPVVRQPGSDPDHPNNPVSPMLCEGISAWAGFSVDKSSSDVVRQTWYERTRTFYATPVRIPLPDFIEKVGSFEDKVFAQARAHGLKKEEGRLRHTFFAYKSSAKVVVTSDSLVSKVGRVDELQRQVSNSLDIWNWHGLVGFTARDLLCDIQSKKAHVSLILEAHTFVKDQMLEIRYHGLTIPAGW